MHHRRASPSPARSLDAGWRHLLKDVFQSLREIPVYAVVRIAGKQFRVSHEERLRVPRLAAEVGSEVHLEDVLAVSSPGSDLLVGAPLVEGARVTLRVLDHERDRKILVFHKKRRKDHRKKNGHQQPYSEVRVTAIQAP